MEPVDIDHASRIEAVHHDHPPYWEVGCSVPVRVLVNLFVHGADSIVVFQI